MPKNEGYRHNWAGPLLAFLKEPFPPIAPIDEQALDRILSHVGERFVPADLDRAALRGAIARAIATKQKIDRSRPSKYSRALRKGVASIHQAAEVLGARLKDNNHARQLIADVLPSVSEDVIHIIAAAEAIAEVLGESHKEIRAKYDRRLPSANEWLAGVELPLIFEEFFHRRAGRSRSDGGPAGPTVRFVHAVMTEIGTPLAKESIVRAMTGLAEIRKRRRSVRKTAKSWTLGKPDAK
jgi:hypothetical protein